MKTLAAVTALSLSLVTLGGCFPHNAHHRTIAKWSEGGALVAGIALGAVASTGADCDTMGSVEQSTSGCRMGGTILSTASLILITGALLGFVATVSTADDEDGNAKPVIIRQPATTTAAAGSGTASVAPKAAQAVH
jgi:hypothetical protein